MAVTITGLVTNNNKSWFEIDGDPSVAPGLAAEMGSLASWDNGSNGKVYEKIGPNDIDWDAISTNTTSGVGEGNYLRLPIYDTNATGFHIDDTVAQNSNNIDVAIEAQPARSAAIEYRIPNPGNAVAAVDFVLTEGAQTINGDKTFGDDVIVQGDLTVNGDLTYVNTTELQITDKVITLNKGGTTSSGGLVGFEIEELGASTGYWKTDADRLGWDSLVPGSAYVANIDQSLLTANHKISLPDTDGVFVARPTGTPGVEGQIAFWNDANNIISDANLTWNSGSSVLSVTNVEVTGSLTLPSFTPGSVIFAGVGGALAEDNANFFFDNSNNRLGLATATPARTLDVNGSSIFKGSMRYADASATKANWEMFEAQTTTTTNVASTIATIAIPTDSHVIIEASILARCTGGVSGVVDNRAAYLRTVSVRNVGGVVTAPVPQADYTYEDVFAWNGTIDVNSTNARIRVTGATATNIDWVVIYKVMVLS